MKDLLKDIMNIKLIIFMISVCTLIPLSFGLSTLEFQQRYTEYQTRRNAGDIVPSPNVLSIVSSGLESELFGNGIKGVIGGALTFDPLWVVKVVLSLLAILLGAGSLSEEWAGGIMRIIFAGPLSKSSFISARLVSGSLSVVYPFAISYGFGVMTMIVMGARLGSSDFVALLLTFLVCSVYLILFYMIGFTFSIFTKSGQLASFVAFVFWTIIVLAIPQNITTAITNKIEVPSVLNIQVQKDKFRSELITQAEVLDKRYDFEVEAKKFNELDKSRLNSIDRQNKIGSVLLTLTPGSLLVLAISDLTNTGLSFYHYTIKNWVAGEPFEGKYQPSFFKNLLPMGIMILFGVLVFLIAFVGFVKIDIV